VNRNSFSVRYKNKLLKRLHELRESYVKRLPYIYVVVLLFLSFLSVFSLYSALMLGIISAIFIIFAFFHSVSVMESIGKLAYAEKLIRLERWRLFLYVFSVSSIIILILLGYGLSYLGLSINLNQLPVPFNQVTAFFFGWYFLFIAISLPLNLYSQTSYRITKLCFRASIDELEKILKQRKLPIKDAYKRFKWLRQGFQSCNDFLIDDPYNVTVKDIDEYYQRIFSFALVGNEEDLEKFSVALQKVLASFGKKKDDFDLPNLLISLQLILGKDVRGKESIQELAEMILVKPSLWERIKAAIKSAYMVSVVSIITLVVAILAILFQFFHWGI
jgi:hypothetical protein